MATANSTASSFCANLDPNVYNLYQLEDLAELLGHRQGNRERHGYLFVLQGNIYFQGYRDAVRLVGELPDGLDAICIENLDGVQDGWYVGPEEDVRHTRRTLERLDRRTAIEEEAMRLRCLEAWRAEEKAEQEAMDWDGMDHGF